MTSPTNEGSPDRTDSKGQPSSGFPPFRDGSVDAGLWSLSQVALDGSAFTLEEIGEVCGLSAEGVRKIEVKALKKLRLELRHRMGMIDEKELRRDNVL